MSAHLIQRKNVNLNKKKLAIEDIVNFKTILDRNKVKLPLFAAAILKNVPTMQPNEMDVCSLLVKMDKLCGTITDIKVQIDALQASRDSLQPRSAAGNMLFSGVSSRNKDALNCVGLATDF